MNEFQLVSNYLPAGDQPKAIQELTDAIKRGDKFQTLLGITGSGKTFSISNLIQNVQKPTLVISPNKTLAAQLYGEFKAFFPNNVSKKQENYYYWLHFLFLFFRPLIDFLVNLMIKICPSV